MSSERERENELKIARFEAKVVIKALKKSELIKSS
jgi:hypothetical protein